MADVFLSDVHLRRDKPERAERLKRVVDTLMPDDRLFVLGDLCDFWFTSRERKPQPDHCVGLASLRDFQQRGGALTMLVGNHDAWMRPHYEHWFGLTVADDPLRIQTHNLCLILSHGHRVKSKAWWKGAMESRAFFSGFSRLPDVVARGLDGLLNRVNDKNRHVTEPRMIDEYRIAADQFAACDVAIFGHVHRVHDDASRKPRLLVLGDWTECDNYARLDDAGLIHHSATLSA